MIEARPTRIAAVAAAPGVARGHWTELRRAELPPPGRIDPTAAPAELARLKAAANDAALELMALSDSVADEGHEAESAIFAAHAAIAWDPVLIAAAAEEIEVRHVDAVGAITIAGRLTAERLAAVADELIRARAADVLDVTDRIARRLAGLPTDEDLLPEPSIVIARDLAPSLTATLPRERLLGIALEAGSATAHAAILARAYGIPAVVGAAGLLAAARAAGPDVELAIDGSTGEAIVDPDAADRARYDQRAAEIVRDRSRDLDEASLAAVTTDGAAITLLANIGSPDEAAAAVGLGATGVGLFRTEFLFLERATPPSEDEQTAAYRRVVEAFGGGPVTIRLLDVGGDKPIPYLPLPREDNPFLGVRALRLAATRPELFVTQLRACYRAATAGPVKVMAPMIADAGDVQTLLALADDALASLRADGIAAGSVTLGVMLEIPSAVLTGRTWFDAVGFASLGTNDLLQYTLAVDRGNPALESYRDSLHPALLRLIAMAAEAASAAHIDLSVCGEMAGDPAAALALVGLGVRSLSMSAPSLAAVRRAIRANALGSLERAAAAALDAPSAAEVRARFTPLVPG
ncbi:MAG TPA: phosphoenolpyruvate--protein phosphotransferase [Verrucomicrobiae bacterium]|nr:phosphoenolpyruvate--protein phosphotransferase [Verrucomicrobiae bacterium]